MCYLFDIGGGEEGEKIRNTNIGLHLEITFTLPVAALPLRVLCHQPSGEPDSTVARKDFVSEFLAGVPLRKPFVEALRVGDDVQVEQETLTRRSSPPLSLDHRLAPVLQTVRGE